MHDACTISVSDKVGKLDTKAAIFLPIAKKIIQRYIL